MVTTTALRDPVSALQAFTAEHSLKNQQSPPAACLQGPTLYLCVASFFSGVLAEKCTRKGFNTVTVAGPIKILRDHGFGGSGDEIELDFEALDNETLWALDDYMETHTKGKSNAGGPANSGQFQVEPESDYESDDSDISE